MARNTNDKWKIDQFNNNNNNNNQRRTSINTLNKIISPVRKEKH